VYASVLMFLSVTACISCGRNSRPRFHKMTLTGNNRHRASDVFCSMVLLTCFTRVLSIKAKSQIIKINQSAESNALNYVKGTVLTVY